MKKLFIVAATIAGIITAQYASAASYTADVNISGTTCLGARGCGGTADWTTGRNAADGDSAYNDGNLTVQTAYSFSIFRNAASFNINGLIPDNAIVSSAVLHYTPTYRLNEASGQMVIGEYVNGQFPVTIADYGGSFTVNGETEYARVDFSDMALNVDNTVSLNGSAITMIQNAIEIQADIPISLRERRDVDNDEPSGTDNIIHVDATMTLDITYSVPAPTPTPDNKFSATGTGAAIGTVSGGIWDMFMVLVRHYFPALVGFAILSILWYLLQAAVKKFTY